MKKLTTKKIYVLIMVDEAPTPFLEEKLKQQYPEIFNLFTLQEIHSYWEEKQQFIPFSQFANDLVERKISQLGMTPDQADACRQMVTVIAGKDPVTGLSTPYSQQLNIQLADLYQKTHADKGSTFYYLMADFINLRGLNYILSGANVKENNPTSVTPEGEKHADKILKIVANIFEEELQAAATASGKKIGALSPSIKCYRTGGDEFSALLVNVSKDDIDQAKDKIIQRVDDLIKHLQLEDVMHPKYGNDIYSRGSGIGLAYVKYDEQDFKHRQHDMAQTIKSERHRHNLKRVDAPQKPQRSGATYCERGMEIQFSPQILEETVRKIDALYERLPNKETKTEPFPFSDMQVVINKDGHNIAENIFLWPSLKRVLQLHAKEKALGMSHEQSTLLRQIYDIYQARDVYTGYKRDSFKEVLQDALAYVRKKPNIDMKALVFEIQNFAGMNDEYGHGVCDEYSATIAKTIAKHLPDSWVYRPLGRGDRIFVLLGDVPAKHMHRALAEISADVYDFAESNGLDILRNPRHEGKQNLGVRMVMAATQLKAEDAIGGIFNRLDAQLTENKQAHRCYLGGEFDTDFIIPFDTVDNASFARGVITQRRKVGPDGQPLPLH